MLLFAILSWKNKCEKKRKTYICSVIWVDLAAPSARAQRRQLKEYIQKRKWMKTVAKESEDKGECEQNRVETPQEHPSLFLFRGFFFFFFFYKWKKGLHARLQPGREIRRYC